MKNSMFLCGALLLAIPGLSVATDYPLVFKTLDAQQALSFPSGSTIYSMMQAAKPAGILKAPPAVSQHPLYGQIPAGTDQLLCRLDESKGSGQGYDRLIVDVNRNGDLTDDPVVSLVPPAGRAGVVSMPQQLLFGPIQAPENLKIGSDRPVFFAQVYMFMAAGISAAPNATVGEILVRPGWYLEASVNVDGKQHKVALVDANCNFRMGDPERPVTSRSGVNGSDTSWYFQGGDRFLVDWDRSGGIQSTVLEDQSRSYGPILYLDAKPYKATLAADCKSLSLDPWAEPLAELALQPRGEQVSSLQVAWEKAPGDWVLLQPGVENGKAKVPPGNYRLYSLVLKGKTASGDSLVMNGIKRAPEGTIKAVAGETASLKCGTPLQINLTSQPTRSSPGLLQGIFGQAAPMQTIQASILGSGGETYSAPQLMGGRGVLRPPPAATYAVLTAEGKQVDSGNLEYG
jgi:hypothetical protein